MGVTRVSTVRWRARCAIHAAMLSDAPVAISLLFVATVVGMLLLVLWGAARAARRVGPGSARGVRLAGVAVAGWLALTGRSRSVTFLGYRLRWQTRMLRSCGSPKRETTSSFAGNMGSDSW